MKIEEHIILADNLLKDKYAFINDLDMERCRTVYNKPDNFNISPNGDNEWIFMRTRMGYLISLFYAYNKTLDIKYIEKIYNIIDEYIENNREIVYSLSTRTLDIAIQMENIVNIMQKLKNEKLLNEEREKAYIIYLEKVCNYLFNSYVSWYDMSNWGLIQMASIYLFSSKYNKNEIKIKAKRLLKKQIELQIEDDGLHYERSMTYHYQIINSIINLVKLNDEENSYLKTILKKLTDSASKMYYPNMKQINNGDSDEMDVSSILEKSYNLLGEKFEKKDHITLFNSSGYFSMMKDNFAVSSYLTKMSSGHIHLDLAHFNYYNNSYIFVDNGRYTYNENETRYSLKDVHSHNGIVIDNKAYTDVLDSWQYSKEYPKVNDIKLKKINKDVIFIVMSYFDLKNNSYIERKLLIIEKNLLIFTNIFSKGEHIVKLNFNLHNDVNVIKKSKNKYILNDILFTGENLDIEKSIYSKEYNIKKESNRIISNHNFKDNIYLINMILEKDVSIEELSIIRNNKTVELDYVKAFLLKTNNKSYTIFIRNKDEYIGTNAYYVENRAYYKDIVVDVVEEV